MAKRREPVRATEERRRGPRDTAAVRRPSDAQTRGRRTTREQRPKRPAPQTGPMPRPVEGPVRPKNAAQAKARAKARKAKAPKVIRPPLRTRMLIRLAAIDFDPRRVVTRVPFVVLVIGALGIGLGVTLWLSTDAAERSYQLGHARQLNQALLQQKEGLERDVLEAQAAPALAESARKLGMIPSTNTAHLVQDGSGNWMVVGTPKPAAGVQPPPLNSPLPLPTAPAPPAPPAPRVVDPREVAVHLPPAVVPGTNAEIPVPTTAGAVPLVAPLGVVPGAPLPAGVPAAAPIDPAAPAAPAAPAVPAAPAAPLAATAPPVDAITQAPVLPGPLPGAEAVQPAPVPAPAPAIAPVPVPGAPA